MTTTGVLLLAAGSARRMDSDKLLADLGGRPMIGRTLDAIAAAELDGLIVAIAPGTSVAALIPDGATIVEVADHAEGMGHSLAAAARAIPSHWDAAIVCLADMPFVRPDTLRALAALAGPNVIVRPWFDGRPCNPVLWGRNHFPDLASLRGNAGGRTLLLDRPVTTMACDDPGVAIDIDTPDTLADARRRFAV